VEGKFMALLSQFLETQRRFQRELMAKGGVVGVGIGYKNAEEGERGEMAIVAMVEQKKPKAAIDSENLIPSQLDGIKTDVIEVGVIRAQVNTGPRDTWRPMIPPGVSIGHHLVTAGTFGALVFDTLTGQAYILSNNHVLANSNDAFLGDMILQPGPTDGGQNPGDLVASLIKYAKLSYTGDSIVGDPNPIISKPVSTPTTPTPPTSPTTPTTPTNPQPEAGGCASLIVSLANGLAKANDPDARVQIVSASAVSSKFDPAEPTTIEAQAAIPENQLDAALAIPKDANMFSKEIMQIGVITGTKPPTLGMSVRKFGRTTGFTTGQITLINATIDVGYSTQKGKQTARFTGQVMTTGMSQGGDSGSLIVDGSSQNAVGLLFAGSGTATIFTPIERVLSKLGVQLTKP
jgi:hypothetical protein